MNFCEECGSRVLTPVHESGVVVFQCDLCGSLSGSADAVATVDGRRAALERGIDPEVYPLVEVLESQPGVHVIASSSGDPSTLVWPFVQIQATELSLVTIDNLAKSLRLAARGHELHWIIEVEHTHSLVFTLKPRFHRSIDKITADLVRRATADLERIRANLASVRHRSWWQRGSTG